VKRQAIGQAMRWSPSSTKGFGFAWCHGGRNVAAAILPMIALLLFVPVASAEITHLYTGVSFGPEGKAGLAEFKEVQSVATEPGTEDVYVLDATEGGSIYKFDSEGEPVEFTSTGTNVINGVGVGPPIERGTLQIAVAPPGSAGATAGDIYVANNNAQGIVRIYGSTGALLGEPKLGGNGEISGVAVNASGRVFVSAFGEAIYEYLPSANPPVPGDLTGTAHTAAEGNVNVGADTAGRVYDVEYGAALVKRQNIADAEPVKIVPKANAIGIDPSSEDAYADLGEKVVQFSSSGEELGSFAQSEISSSYGVAPLKEGAKVFVATPNVVKIYGPAVFTPDVKIGSATQIAERSATLNGTIDPLGGPPATCEFEYLVESYDAESVPCEPSGPFTGSGENEVTAHIIGLSPAAEYSVRLIATSSNGTSKSGYGSFTTIPSPFPSEPIFGPCPNADFRIGAGEDLPDCRAYELATPTDKSGLNIGGIDDILRASSESTEPRASFMLTSGTGFPSEGGRQNLTPMLASLGAGSWSTRSLFPPESSGPLAIFSDESANLRFVVDELIEEANFGEKKASLVLIDSSTGNVTQIVPYQSEATGGGSFGVDAVSDDGHFVLFETKAALASGARPGFDNLYRWDSESNSISLVDLLPAGEGGDAPPQGAFGGSPRSEPESYEEGGALAGQYVEALHASTASGDQIYFTAAGAGQIYLRQGMNGSTPSTLRVSKPNQGVKDPVDEELYFGYPLPAAFQEATTDGSKAFFLSSEKLTEDSATGPEDVGRDLYVFDRSTNELEDVTGGLEDYRNPNGARVIALLGVSSDGSSGYFVARGDLGGGAVSGAPNIYRFERQGNGSYATTFVATLSETAETTDRLNWATQTYSANTENEPAYGRSSRVSANGEELLFSSTGQLTTYNNRGCGFGRNEPCSEVFLYSASSNELFCLSCNPTGAKPLGSASLTAFWLNVGSAVTTTRPSPYLTRNISSDGNRIFFQTPDPLVARDTNGSSCRYLKEEEAHSTRRLPTCVDVYEWEAPGTPGGTCTHVEIDGGCMYLLSAGDSDDTSDFVDASADGSVAYIATSSTLVPADRDDLYDIYAVRSDGGLASQFEIPGPTCQGEGCRSSATEPLASPVPGSSSLVGPGNEKPKACKKGFVRKGDKCVRKGPKKKQATKKKHRRKSNGHGKPSSSKGKSK
jgi:hypothetical protein